MSKGRTSGRLDDVGQLGALLMRLGTFDKDRLEAFHTAHHKDKPMTRSPFILPGMARVTTAPTGEGFGALMHAKSDGTVGIEGEPVLWEQWIVEKADRSEVTMDFGGLQFTGIPMAYPKRLPRHGPGAAARTHWLPLSNGLQVSPTQFFATMQERSSEVAYAIARTTRLDWSTSRPSGTAMGWREVLENPGYPQDNQKMWVHAEPNVAHQGYVSSVLHVVWQVEHRFEPIPKDSAFSDALAPGTLDAWACQIERTFNTASTNSDFRYYLSELRLYETPPGALPTW
jgi:hypothetical protein